MRRSPILAASLAAVASVALGASWGCGSGSSARGGPTEPPELRTLSENRALAILNEVLADEGIARGPAWTVRIGAETDLDVDVRLGRSSFGVEWISARDRAELGDAVPPPADGGQLRIAAGLGDDAGAQILILEHAAYEFANEREHVQRGAPSARETEERLRRDARDFLHYVRGQGASL